MIIEADFIKLKKLIARYAETQVHLSWAGAGDLNEASATRTRAEGALYNMNRYIAALIEDVNATEANYIKDKLTKKDI